MAINNNTTKINELIDAINALPEAGSGLDTSDATATANDIAMNKTAYVNGEKISGNVSVWDGEFDTSNAYMRWRDDTGVNFELPWGFNIMFKNGSSIKGVFDKSNFGDATASDVLSGKTFTSANGLKVTGTMPDNKFWFDGISDKTQIKYIPKGYHDGTGFVCIMQGEADKLIADNIKSGVSILGVTGTYEGASGGGLPVGVSALASGEFVASQNYTTRVDLQHGLGVTPNFCAVILKSDTSSSVLTSTLVGATVFYKPTKYNSSSTIMYRAHIMMEGYNASNTSSGTATRADSSAYFTTTTFGIPCNSTYKIASGLKYQWVCGVLDNVL